MTRKYLVSSTILILNLTFLVSMAFAGDLKNGADKEPDVLVGYIEKIHKKVYDNWNYPSEGPSYENEVVISFNIYPQGNIDQPVFKQSSLVEMLDDLALRAILDSRPFPSFPKEIRSSDLNFTIHFKYIPENINQAQDFQSMPSIAFVDEKQQEEERKLEEELRLAREQRIKVLLKSVENRMPAGKGLGYKDFYFGDSLDLVEGLKRKHCNPTKQPFMKGDFKTKFLSLINIDEIETLDGWCFNDSKFMHFLFKNKLTRIIWEVSAKPDKEGVIQTYKRLRKQLASGNEYRLTKARSSNTLKREKGQRKTTLIDEFDDGALLLVLELEKNQSEIYVIYQDEKAAKYYNKFTNKDERPSLEITDIYE